MHIRQPEIPPLKPIRELLVIKPQQMQQRGMQVMHMDLPIHHTKT